MNSSFNVPTCANYSRVIPFRTIVSLFQAVLILGPFINLMIHFHHNQTGNTKLTFLKWYVSDIKLRILSVSKFIIFVQI